MPGKKKQKIVVEYNLRSHTNFSFIYIKDRIVKFRTINKINVEISSKISVRLGLVYQEFVNDKISLIFYWKR